MNTTRKINVLFAVLFIVVLACNVPATEIPPTGTPEAAPTAAIGEAESSPEPPPVVHVQTPPIDFPAGARGVDVESSGTGAEGRAPYGDSYDISLFERPFLVNMTYVPDLDIASFGISRDDDWYFAAIRLIGSDPNNPLGIHYAVELDLNRDGFGDFLIWGSPPYREEWTAENVQVFADLNKDTGGVSATKSDVPFFGDGYETLIFDPAQAIGDDPDLAWVRMSGGGSSIEFAFKRSLAGDSFLYGMMADAGLKDVSMFDYVDRFSEEVAGSPVRDKRYYPLQELHSMDNTCREAFGFAPTGYEPRICPKAPPPSAGGGSGQSGGGSTPPSGQGCVGISPSDCTGGAPFFWPYPHCACSSTPFYESPP